MGIGTVAVFSEPDRDAPFVREADQAFALGGAAPSESYLVIDRLLEAARASGADALHPGYGFLAENAELARALRGGRPHLHRPAGRRHRRDGLEARGQAAHVGGRRSDAAERRARGRESRTPADLERVAKEIGLPLLVKASAGGGGKGMRIVRDARELADAVQSARREAESAFGDGTVYLERYLDGARHVEVQIFGDTHGNVIHLGERECSIQRRHQKILEESPCTALDDGRRAALCDAAVAGCKAIGYVGAGTVEFLLAADGSFYFLEVNTRLQVEHPVTEMVRGLDLVRLQIEVARGAKLPSASRASARRAVTRSRCASTPKIPSRSSCRRPVRSNASRLRRAKGFGSTPASRPARW